MEASKSSKLGGKLKSEIARFLLHLRQVIASSRAKELVQVTGNLVSCVNICLKDVWVDLPVRERFLLHSRLKEL